MSTSERILAAAGKLFATQGYTDTSLAQVALAAEVSKPLILWHSDTKEDLFRTALQNFLSPYSIDAKRLQGLNEREQFEKLIDDYYEFIAQHLSSVKFVLGQVVREEENAKEVVDHISALYQVYQQLLASILEQGRKTALFYPHIHPAEDAALIMATLNGLLIQRLVDQRSRIDARDLLVRFKETLQARLYRPGPPSVSVHAPKCDGAPASHSSVER